MARFSSDPQTERSLRHSLKDSAAFAAMTGAGETYISAFALFLGASTAQMGLLASLPPMLASFVQLFSAWLGQSTNRRKALILAGASAQGLVWVPLLVLPLLYPEVGVELLILCVIAYFATANLAAPQWSSLIGDIVPPRRRGRFFGVRTQLVTAVTFISLIAGGGTLHLLSERDQTIYGFVILFSAALLARIISVYHLALMHDPGSDAGPTGHFINKDWWERLRHSNFARFSAYFALMQLGVAISAPFFTVYMLRDLQVSYLEFTLVIGTAVLAQFLTLERWGRISDIFGNLRILRICGLLLPVIPLLWLFSTQLWYLLLIQVISGFCWAGFSLSAGNFLYDLIPPHRRLNYMAVHNVVASIGVFCGAMLGGVIGEYLPATLVVGPLQWDWISSLYGLFILSACVRLLVSLIFLPRLREVRTVRPISFGGVIFRVTRVNALAGLVFDIVGNLPKRREESD